MGSGEGLVITTFKFYSKPYGSSLAEQSRPLGFLKVLSRVPENMLPLQGVRGFIWNSIIIIAGKPFCLGIRYPLFMEC